MHGDPIKRIDKAIAEGRLHVRRDQIAELRSERGMERAERALRKSLKSMLEAGQGLADKPPSDKRPDFPKVFFEAMPAKLATYCSMSERERVLSLVGQARDLSEHILMMLEPVDTSELG